MPLTDQYGNPLQKANLLQEEATPSLTGVRTILSNSPSTGLNPYRMASILRSAEEGDAEAYLELAEELEEKDPHYLSVIGTRKRAVSQLEITVEAASDDPNDIANADLIRSWLNRDELDSEVFNILDAIGKGYSVTEIIWETSENAWMPKELKWRDPRWFVFDRNDGQTLMLREGAATVPLTPYKYIVHYHQAKSGLPIRSGVARPCVWMWMFKNFSIKDWVIFAEAYGQPVRVGKYGPGATKDDREVLLRAVANIGSDAAAIIPDSMVIDFIEAQSKTGTADVFQRLAEFCDRQMSKAVLGQTTTADAISGGHAVSKEHNEVRRDIERSDAKQLGPTLTQQLVVPIIVLNKGPQKAYPRIRVGRSEDVDIDKLSQTIDRAVKVGMKISERRSREMLNLPEPESVNDILQAAPGTLSDIKEEASARHELAAEDKAKDAIDELASHVSEDWEQVMTPIVGLIEKAMTDSSSFEEFEEKLLQLTGRLEIDALSLRIAQAAFSTRIAGNLEIDLEK